MSQLIPFLSKLKESGSERVFFAPNEEAVALDGEVRRAMPGGPIRGATILEAVSELLSQDDITGLSSRPRIVRHEHDGEDFVLEIVRQASGVALGIRQAAKPARALRDSVRRDDPPVASKSPVPGDARRQDPGPAPARAKRPSRRPQGVGGDRETPVIEEARAGAPAMELDLGSRVGHGARNLPDERLDTKPVRRPDGQARTPAPPAGDGAAAEELIRRATEAARAAATEIAARGRGRGAQPRGMQRAGRGAIARARSPARNWRAGRRHPQRAGRAQDRP
ncbi:MAG: hypothetical protein KF795_07300 [Labilithrix sp.]|nr:hypothetical protein [Labilithrix sp.]